MNIYEHIESLDKKDSVDMANKIIDHCSNMLNCGSESGTIITHHVEYYKNLIDEDPATTVELVLDNVANLKSIEKCGTRELFYRYIKEVTEEVAEKFLPEEE